MKEVGIMGGAFNPPHNMHLLVGQRACEQFSLGKVLFIPSGEPPHKKAELLDKERRFELVKACVRGNPRFEASRIEIDRPGITWSIDTLIELNEKLGSRYRLNFIIGDDNLKTLMDYQRRDEFLSLCRLLVCPRKSELTSKQRKRWAKNLGLDELCVIDCPCFPLSSTLVRDWVSAGRSIRYLVPAAVAKIVAREGYYSQTPAE